MTKKMLTEKGDRKTLESLGHKTFGSLYILLSVIQFDINVEEQ